MDLVFCFVVLTQLTLLCSLVVYRFVFSPGSKGSWATERTRKGGVVFGSMRHNRDEGKEEEESGDDEDPAGILFDKGYHDFIQKSGVCYASERTNPFTTNELAACYITQSLRHKQRQEKEVKNTVQATPKFPVVVGLFSTEKPATAVPRIAQGETRKGLLCCEDEGRSSEKDNDEEGTPVRRRLSFCDKPEGTAGPTSKARLRLVREVPASWLEEDKEDCGWSLSCAKVADEGTLFSAEVAVGKALTKEKSQAVQELRSVLGVLQKMAPKTEEVKARQDSLLRFAKEKLQCLTC